MSAILAGLLVVSAIPAAARDYGQQGTVFPVSEVNFLQAMAARLKAMQASGELQRKQVEFRERSLAAIRRPAPVPGLTPADRPNIRLYDPSMVFDQDIRDSKGRLVVAAGTRVNPLDFLPYNQTFVFFNADRKEELDYVLAHYRGKANVKLVMIKGSPIEAMKTHRQRFYFDQGGYLTTKLGIIHTPSVVEPAGKYLRISEVPL